MHETTDAKVGRPQSRGFEATRGEIFRLPFEWSMVNNNLLSTTVKAVIGIRHAMITI